MNRVLFRFVYRIRTNDNWRWLTLASVATFSFVAMLAFFPYVFAPSETAGMRAERELYEYASRSWGEPSLTTRGWDDRLGGLLPVLGIAAATIFTLSTLVAAVYFFPAFGDDARRALEAARMKSWDRYGAEIRSTGFLMRLLAGERPPAGSSPAAPAPPSAGGGALTTGKYLTLELLSDFAQEFLAHWRR